MVFGADPAKTFTSTGGNQSVAAGFDPIGGTTDSCKAIGIVNEGNSATYRHRFDRPLTMLGRPTVRAQIQTTGQFGQIAARLWNLMPNGQQRLVDRGIYSLRNDQSGPITSSSTATATASAKATGSRSSSSGATLPITRLHFLAQCKPWR